MRARLFLPRERPLPGPRAQMLVAVCAFLLLLSAGAHAQTITNVTGTVTDPNGIPYSNARLTVTLSIPGATVQVTNQQTCSSGGFGSQPCYIPFSTTIGPITLDNTGSFALALYSNAGIYNLQGGAVTTQWYFNVNISPAVPLPFGTGPQQFSMPATISGASQDVSTTLDAVAPKLTNFVTGGTLPIYNVACSNINATDTPLINAAINAAVAASPSGGVINIGAINGSPCTWTPPNPLPAPTAWVTLNLQTPLTVLSTLHIRSLYKLTGGANSGGPNPGFSWNSTTQITPSPNSISPVVEEDFVAGSANPMGAQHITIGGNFTGIGFQSGTTANGVSQDFVDDVNAVSSSNTATPLQVYGGYGHEICGGSYAPGSSSTNPSMHFTSISATGDFVRATRISSWCGFGQVSMNFQGILIDAQAGGVYGNCETTFEVDGVLMENGTGSGSTHFLNTDLTNNCVSGINIVQPVISDNLAPTAVVNTGSSSANSISDVRIIQPVNPLNSAVPLTAGTRLISGCFAQFSGAPTAANIGSGCAGGLFLDGSGIIYGGLSGCPAGGFCGVFGGINDSTLDASSSWEFQVDPTQLGNNSVTDRARTSQTGFIHRFCNQALTSCDTFDVNGTFAAHVLTVGTLPSAASAGAGAMIPVRDATTFTVGACTGGGSDYMIALSNGTTWTCH